MPLDLKETFPLGHEQAVQILLRAPWTREENKILDEKCLATLDRTFGAALREFWHLGEISFPLPRHYRETYQLGSPEDMSSLIILDFLGRRKDQEVDLQVHVRRMKRQWIEQGIDPLTLEKSES